MLAVALAIGAGVAAAMLVDASTEPAGRPTPQPVSGTEPPTAASSTAPPATSPPTSTTVLPGAPLPVSPRPGLVAWSGDSVPDSLADAITAEAAARGVRVVDRTTSGCGMVRGLPADENLAPIDFVRACDAAVPVHQRDTAAMRPDVVTWLSTWETANRLVDGQGMRFGTPEGDATLLALIDESVARLSAFGARVVFLTMPPNTTGPNRPVVTAADAAAAVHLNDLLTQYAAAHPDVASVLDLAALVCPGGPPCPTEVEGVTLRPVDGGHFAGDGPGWVAPRVLDRLLGPG